MKTGPSTQSFHARTGGVLGVILLVIAGFVCAAVLAVVVVVKTVQVRGKGDHVTIDTPGGTFEIQGHKKLDIETVGIPVYPGAVPSSKSNIGGASFAWSSVDGKTDKAVTLAGASYVTQDSSDRVLDFYRGKLNNWVYRKKKDGELNLEHTEGNWKRIVSIQERKDGTHIGVASIGEPAGN